MYQMCRTGIKPDLTTQAKCKPESLTPVAALNLLTELRLREQRCIDVNLGAIACLASCIINIDKLSIKVLRPSNELAPNNPGQSNQLQTQMSH